MEQQHEPDGDRAQALEIGPEAATGRRRLVGERSAQPAGPAGRTSAAAEASAPAGETSVLAGEASTADGGRPGRGGVGAGRGGVGAGRSGVGAGRDHRGASLGQGGVDGARQRAELLCLVGDPVGRLGSGLSREERLLAVGEGVDLGCELRHGGRQHLSLLSKPGGDRHELGSSLAGHLLAAELVADEVIRLHVGGRARPQRGAIGLVTKGLDAGVEAATRVHGLHRLDPDPLEQVELAEVQRLQGGALLRRRVGAGGARCSPAGGDRAQAAQYHSVRNWVSRANGSVPRCSSSRPAPSGSRVDTIAPRLTSRRQASANGARRACDPLKTPGTAW